MNAVSSAVAACRAKNLKAMSSYSTPQHDAFNDL